MLRITLILFSFLFLIKSYSQFDNKFDTDSVAVQKDFMTWWTYFSRNIKLSESFLSYDEKYQALGKEDFLKLLSTGEFIPIRLSSLNNQFRYKLTKIIKDVNKDIKTTIVQTANYELHNFHLEGTEILNFKFIDLKGNVFTKGNTKGKILVLKCWYIHCQQCVAEIPDLNKLINRYNKDRVNFVAIAFDKPQELKGFLKENHFDYSVASLTEVLLRIV